MTQTYIALAQLGATRQWLLELPKWRFGVLTSYQHDLLRRRYFAGAGFPTCAQIASDLGVSTRTAWVTIERALGKLQAAEAKATAELVSIDRRSQPVTVDRTLAGCDAAILKTRKGDQMGENRLWIVQAVAVRQWLQALDPALLRQLTARQQQCLTLRYLDETGNFPSYQSMARRLGVTITTARTNTERGLRRLRQLAATQNGQSAAPPPVKKARKARRSSAQRPL